MLTLTGGWSVDVNPTPPSRTFLAASRSCHVRAGLPDGRAGRHPGGAAAHGAARAQAAGVRGQIGERCCAYPHMLACALAGCCPALSCVRHSTRPHAPKLLEFVGRSVSGAFLSSALNLHPSACLSHIGLMAFILFFHLTYTQARQWPMNCLPYTYLPYRRTAGRGPAVPAARAVPPAAPAGGAPGVHAAAARHRAAVLRGDDARDGGGLTERARVHMCVHMNTVLGVAWGYCRQGDDAGDGGGLPAGVHGCHHSALRCRGLVGTGRCEHIWDAGHLGQCCWGEGSDELPLMLVCMQNGVQSHPPMSRASPTPAGPGHPAVLPPRRPVQLRLRARLRPRLLPHIAVRDVPHLCGQTDGGQRARRMRDRAAEPGAQRGQAGGRRKECWVAGY